MTPPRKPPTISVEPATQETIISRLARIENDTEEIMRILRGSNGDTGLIASVQTLAKEVRDHVNEEFKCPIREVATLLYGSKDDASKRGMVSDVEELKKWRADLNKWYALFIGAIIIGLANLLLELLGRL